MRKLTGREIKEFKEGLKNIKEKKKNTTPIRCNPSTLRESIEYILYDIENMEKEQIRYALYEALKKK